MLWTLHRYIFVQTAKTFTFAFISLVLLFVLGGGTAVFVRGTEQNPLDILFIVLPVAATTMAPLALLLATTMTFGRMSADSELDACRASGVNMTHLLLTPLLLSVLATGLVAYSVCQWIPQRIEKLTSSVRDSVKDAVYAQLRLNGAIKFSDIALYVDSVEKGNDPANPKVDVLDLSGVAFTQASGLQLLRHGTAQRASVRFEPSATGGLQVRVIMHDLRMHDALLRQWVELREQPFGPHDVPSFIPPRVKWLPYDRLLAVLDDPFAFEPVRDRRDQLAMAISVATGLREAHSALVAGALELQTEQSTLRVRTSKATLDLDRSQVSLEADVEVEAQEGAGKPKVIRAARGELAVETVLDRRLTLTLIAGGEPRQPITVEDPSAVAEKVKPLNQPRYTFEKSPMAATHLERARELVLGPDAEQAATHLGEPAQQLADRLASEKLKNRLEILAELNWRPAYSASTLILIPLGAILGIRFRGAHALTAFAVSTAPALLVMLGVLLGRNALTGNEQEALGVALIWAGDGACLLLLLAALIWGLRR